MGERVRSRILAIAVVWIVILGVAAVAWRVLVHPAMSDRAQRDALVEQYTALAEDAETRGVTAPPLPDDADPDVIRTMTDDLKALMTGSAPIGAGSVDATIGLALDSFSGYSIFRNPDFHRTLAAEGLGVRLVDDGADYGRRFDTLERGTTPCAVFTIDALLTIAAQRGRLPGTIVMMIDETTGADAMVSYADAIPDIDALNRPDARLVITPDSPSETLARVVMANFSLDQLPDDPFLTENGAGEVFERFRSSSRTDPRAFVLWEPYVSKALEEPGVHVLMDSSRFRGFIVDVLVVQRDYLLEHEDRVRALVEAYFRTLYTAQRDQSSMRALVRNDARSGGESLTEPQVARLVEGIWWKNTRENFAHFGIQGGIGDGRGDRALPRLDQMISNITAVLTRTGAITKDPTGGSPQRAYYDRVLRSLHEDRFHPGAGGAGAEEIVRTHDALEPLTDAEWAALVPVGTLAVDRIVFARGTARLSRPGEHALKTLAGTLESFPQYYLVINGHARRDGDPDANRQLAEDRSRAVADHLRSLGVPSVRIRSTSVEPRATGGREQSVSFVLSQRPY